MSVINNKMTFVQMQRRDAVILNDVWFSEKLRCLKHLRET
jgi:hypothetical protein